ncbi:helix-turn-helix domain-containing protein [Nocardiopsis sp. NPDC058631]|uniref:helix-turn-helix domain-containing protein n=1 Tax=Nocardiopsis sp. NPDC058631 TaxID=3346566 RepID=UPI003669F41F
MSILHMQMVFDAEGLNHSEKAVLLAYCNYTDAHGYVWAGVPRVSDDTGASESTVKRVRRELQDRGLLATKRRVDPRTGRSTSNITRINLDRLAAMKRAPREYDDNVIEELGFTESAEPQTPSDLRTGQSDLGSELRIGQIDPGPGVNLTSPKGQVNLTPNPSDEPSGSSSSGAASTTPSPVASAEEEEGTPSAGTERWGVLPIDLVVEATDATREEAAALVEILRPEAKKSLGGLIRRMAQKGDLDHRLWLLRRQSAPQARTGGSGRAARCALHVPSPVPCGSCRADLAVVGDTAQAVIDLYTSLGPDAATLRPDLARHPRIAVLAAV